MKDSLPRDAGHTFVWFGFRAGVNFLVGVGLARWLGAAGRGQYALLESTAWFLALFLGFSLGQGLTYRIARHQASGKDLLRWAVALTTVQILVVWLGAWAILPWLPAGRILPAGVVGLPEALALYVGAFNLSAWSGAILRGQLRIVTANGCEALGLTVNAWLLLYLYFGWPAPVWPRGLAVILGTAIFGLAAAAVGAAYRISNLPQPEARPLTPADGREILAYSGVSHAANLLQWLNYRVDLYLVHFFLGAASLGVYAVAVTVAQIPWLLSRSLANAYFPHVAGQAGDEASARRGAGLAARTFWACLGTGGLLSVLAVWWVPAVYGGDYAAAARLLGWLLPGVAIFGLANPLASHIIGQGRPGVNLIGSAIGVVSGVALDLWLIPRYGLTGAAAATTISYLLNAAWLMGWYCRQWRLSPGRLFWPSR